MMKEYEEKEYDIQELATINIKNREYIAYLEKTLTHYRKMVEKNGQKEEDEDLPDIIQELKLKQKRNTTIIFKEKIKNRKLEEKLENNLSEYAKIIDDLEQRVFLLKNENILLKKQLNSTQYNADEILDNNKRIIDDLERKRVDALNKQEELQKKIMTIENSRGWKLLDKIRRIKNRI